MIRGVTDAPLHLHVSKTIRTTTMSFLLIHLRKAFLLVLIKTLINVLHFASQISTETQERDRFTHLTYLFLFIPLQVLGIWDLMNSLVFNYCLVHTTVINAVHMMCTAIKKVMMEKFLLRLTLDSWKEVAKRFRE